MVHVIAILTAHPGMRGALLASVQANLAAVRAEEGCLEYGPAIDAARTPATFGADRLIIIEKWADAEALAAHARAPHMAAFTMATKELIAARAIHVLQPV